MKIIQALFLSLVFASCRIYSPYGAATSGASSFSVEYFETVHPLVSASTAITISEALIDRVQRQSTLQLTDNGELKFEGKVIGWTVQPVNVQGNETAGANRVTITVDAIFTNTIDENLSFQRKFSRFYDLSSNQDIHSNTDLVVEEISALLSQDIFNASLGNW
ncbi:MAG: hypothetical protein CMB32_03800 [Euryarchaeota archaeon]|nr:hypothetical protein [Euryarchaeota archaeon]|tara:strand:+ start:1190 stop:1678 length:489 start_codon:yes stop_codon:yes gene_type:complete